MAVAKPDEWKLYRQMLRCRRFEELVRDLWDAGQISGEMHLGLGEEGIVAGVGAHLADGDALALDHRGTAALLVRGVDPSALLAEMLGRPDGLSGGRGGHMHLLSKRYLAASSGIVGAAGPHAAGFALAADQLGSGSIAVGYFGDGAMNQGMVLESLNLAVAWNLPVVFVCKDSGWAITTPRDLVTGGDLADRARAFGMPSHALNGWDTLEVWEAARRAVSRARKGDGPSFILARCTHLEGHFLGDPLLRLEHHPLREGRNMAGPLLRAATALRGGSVNERLESAASIATLLRDHDADHHTRARDPLTGWRERLSERDRARTGQIEAVVETEMTALRDRALERIAG